MIFLIGSILLSSFLTIAFKICEKLRIDTFQAIVFNYFTCVVTGLLFTQDLPKVNDIISEEWLPWSVLMGLFFITFFNVTALTVKQNGVAVASVANKLSLVIPFVFSILLYNEPAGIVKVAGIFVALLSVFLTCYKTNLTGKKGFSYYTLLLPGFLFMGSGLLDAIIKYTEQRFITDLNRDIYLICCFGVALITGAIIFIFKLSFKKLQFDARAVVAGICIGIPNYFSIWCLVAVLQEFKASSSAIIPVNNMGIVLISALVAWLGFKERLSLINGAGIILALLSILMITSAI